MRDAFQKQQFEGVDLCHEREKNQNKMTKNTVVFGHDKDTYVRSVNRRSNVQDLANNSKDSRIAAEGIKQKLGSHNFRFGSYKPEYEQSSNITDKQLATQAAIDKAQKLFKPQNVNKKMYSTQNSWSTKKKLKANNSLITQSKTNLQSPEQSLSREKSFEGTLYAKIRDVDINELKKSSIKFGDSGIFNELSNSFKQRSNMIWRNNKDKLSNTLSRLKNVSPISKRENFHKGNINIGGHKTTQDLSTSNNENFKVNEVSNEIREKDREVHKIMKKRNVHLGSCSNVPSTELSSRYPDYNKEAINNSINDQFQNSNFKKSIYLSGSPQRKRDRPTASKLSVYGDQVSSTNDASDMHQKSKDLKRELLAHAFNLGYGVDTHKKGPTADVIQHMRNNLVPANEHSNFRKKNAIDNFSHTDGSGNNLSSSYRTTKNRYIKGPPASKLPIDYWKTNFSFNQVSQQTETGSLASPVVESNVGSLKSSMGSTRTDFSELKNITRMHNDPKTLMRNKAKSIKSSFTVGYSKGDFGT